MVGSHELTSSLLVANMKEIVVRGSPPAAVQPCVLEYKENMVRIKSHTPLRRNGSMENDEMLDTSKTYVL